MDSDFYFGLAVGIVGIIVFYFIMKRSHDSELDQIEYGYHKALENSKTSQRSSIKGKIYEQVAPILPEFAKLHNFGDVRFLGSPIDFVVFKNMSQFKEGSKDNPEIELAFVEIKTGSGELSDLQKAIKKACKSKEIPFDEIYADIDSLNNPK
ncbi:MAG TPA: Holliday junction resolvase-like protein [Nitrosopumilaceae archaeon]|nr:Holliday junction resolvase-like protein [Nitrosopumilaceae archaeon]